MTTEEIKNYNRMCAELLDLKHIEDGDVWISSKLSFYNYTRSSDLKFHSDWNWIMEVIDKIEELKFNNETCTNQRPCFTIGSRWCYVHICNDSMPNGSPKNGKYYYWSLGDQCVYGETKQEAVVQAIYKFLTWYNNGRIS